MRRGAVIGSAFLALSLAGATKLPAEGTLPPAEGDQVVAYITRAPYASWPLWPGKSRFYKGAHPHGAFLTTYVSPDAEKAIREKAGVLPDGAFVIKENYTPGKKLAAVTVMYKKQGYDPAVGDWYWLKYAPNGTIQQEGQVAGCINCHRGVQSNDWLFSGPVN